MNEPQRLRDLSPDTLERSLLEAGMAYRSSDAARAKTIAALGLAGSAALSASVASAASSSVFSKLGWTKLVAISGLGAAVAVPAAYYAVEPGEPAALPQSVVAASPAPKAPVRAVPPVQAPADGLEAVPATELPEEIEIQSVPAPRADRAASQSALAAELAALDKARGRLAAGDASGALAQLDDYGRSFPRGRLALEAEVLRIDALAKSGQSGAAARRAENFLRRHPNSVLASRVRAYLPE